MTSSASFPKSDKRDVDAAVAAAKKAFPGWRNTPAPRRGEVLYAAGEILKRDKEKLARLMTREMGKVLAETRGDVQEAIDMAYLAAGEGRRLFGVTTPSELPEQVRDVRPAAGRRLRAGHARGTSRWRSPRGSRWPR